MMQKSNYSPPVLFTLQIVNQTNLVPLAAIATAAGFLVGAAAVNAALGDDRMGKKALPALQSTTSQGFEYASF